MATKLFVGGIPFKATDNDLKEFFATAGTVVSAQIIVDKFSGRSKGFGFVEMSTEEEAQEAVAKLNGADMQGRKILVDQARPMEKREGGFDRPPRP